MNESAVEYYKPATDFKDSPTAFIVERYKNAEAIRRVKKAMDDIEGVISLLGLWDAENDLKHGLSSACIDLDQIVLPQLRGKVTRGVWS